MSVTRIVPRSKFQLIDTHALQFFHHIYQRKLRQQRREYSNFHLTLPEFAVVFVLVYDGHTKASWLVLRVRPEGSRNSCRFQGMERCCKLISRCRSPTA